MMAVETVEVYMEGHGHLPGAMKASDRESDKVSTVSYRVALIYLTEKSISS
jgi:hypothetical protein